MKTNTTQRELAQAQKKTYKTPRLKPLGNVKKLTLKTGSATDGFGSFA